MEIKKTNDSCTLTFTADEFRIFKDSCKQTILSSVMLEESIKNTPDELKNDENFNGVIKRLKEVLVFSKAFEEKYNKEFNDKLISSDELAEREKYFKELQNYTQENKENEK
jgi:hypothetical protein